MWKLLRMFHRTRDGNASQRNHGGRGISRISAAELASLFVHAPENLMIFDLREPNEIEDHPYGIPGALPTTDANLRTLVPWIPPGTVVVLYATANTPVHDAFLHLRSRKVKFYAVEGGIRSWQEAGLRTEHLVLGDRRSVDNK
jgi:rhodanese-related sulfurtransferase